MLKIDWNQEAVKNAVQKHRAAYAVLDEVLRDLSNGIEVWRMGRKGPVIWVRGASSRITVARRYYLELLELLKTDSFCVLGPERLHEVCKNMRIRELPKGVRTVLQELYDYDRFGKGMVPEYDSKKHVLSWSNSPDGWCAWQYIRALDIHSCVYCNADTVFAVQVTQGTRAVKKRSALDHFYSHADFPFVGITLANLIPACTRCNSNIKGSRELEYGRYIYPYEDAFDEGARFSVAYAPGKSIVDLSPDDVVVTILPCRESGSREKAMKSAEFFCLREVYNQLHSGDALAVLQRVLMYSDSYREFLRKKYPGIGDTILDRIQHGMSLGPNDLMKHNLAKMTKDIVRQFKGE